MNANGQNFFITAIQAVYRFGNYALLRKIPMGNAFLYLLVFCALFGAISSVNLYRNLEVGVGDIQKAFNEKAPEFSLTEKGIHVDAKMPFVTKTEDTIIVIDTSRPISRKVLEGYEKGVLVERNKIIYKRDMIRTEEYNMEALKSFAPITKADIARWISYLRYGIPVVIVFYAVFFYVGKIFWALIVSLFGLIVMSIMKMSLEFGDVFKLSIYSLTMPVILETILEVGGISLPYFVVLYLGIALLYLGLGFREIKKEVIA
ncbi:MAG: DUF1189 domain-containing protein [Spirochaetes bacterium]|nr:DUF1189 domain-containing protein [Spirochaetota bacterium]